ncbi:hypothetical protein Pelo_6423 [Pelomyxa schiedti]|nr:hypothetical protein Pelo_6423 [Pelomyxa schiedti]
MAASSSCEGGEEHSAAEYASYYVQCGASLSLINAAHETVRLVLAPVGGAVCSCEVTAMTSSAPTSSSAAATANVGTATGASGSTCSSSGAMATGCTPWKALIVSDLHLSMGNESYFPRHAQVQMFDTLRTVLSAENPSEVFILGDIFHFTNDINPEWALDTVIRISELCRRKITIIGGNHDRHVFSQWGAQWSNLLADSIRIYDTKFIHLSSPHLRNAIILTHDGGNPLWLDPDQNNIFLLGLRGANGIPPNDILCTGHIHPQTNLLSTHKTASVGSCTSNGMAFHYAVITTEDSSTGGSFRLWLTDAGRLQSHRPSNTLFFSNNTESGL